MDDQQAEFYHDYLALYEEYDLLEPDNDYAWDSWMRRAMLIVIKQRLYEIIKGGEPKSAAENIDG